MFVPRPRSSEDFEGVRALVRLRLSDYEIARRTGIPRSTVLNWRGRTSPPGIRAPTPRLRHAHEWRPSDDTAYAYLLGLYLGDGCIGETNRHTPRLALSLDAGYPHIVGGAISALEATLPGVRIGHQRRRGCVVVLASHPIWPHAFPQHGPGRKHTRRIVLARWQRDLTAQHPRALIRGLIHSDGSRVINRFQTRLPSGRVADYSYVRYFFTNYSADIRGIFCEHCDLLGIRWTQSSFKNISVAHRDSVAILDSFVGPKS